MIIQLDATVSRLKPPRVWKDKDGHDLQTSLLLVQAGEETVGISYTAPPKLGLDPGARVVMLLEVEAKRPVSVELSVPGPPERPAK